MKITIENQAILKRLQDKTFNYSVERWEDDFRETKKRMKNMSEYPLVFQSNPGYLKAKQRLDYLMTVLVSKLPQKFQELS